MNFGPWEITPDGIRALYQSGDALNETEIVSASELPPATISATIVVSVGGNYTTGTITGTANEISVSQTGADIVIALDAGYYLKGVTNAGQLRTKAGLGTIATEDIIAVSADSSANTAAPVGAAYVQAEVQAILDELRTLKTELRDLKTKARTAGVLAT